MVSRTGFFIDSDFLGYAGSFPRPLRDVALRMAWAGMQGRTVQQWEIDFFIHGGLSIPLSIELEYDPPCYVIREEAPPNQPPVEIGLLAADCIHSLRASLDYLARQLVHACDKTPEDLRHPRTAFPILDIEKPERVPDIPPGTNRDIRAALASVQPYNDGPEYRKHPLSTLNYLANLDKHRLFNTTVMHAGYRVHGIALSSGDLIPLDIGEGWRPRELPREVARIPVDEVDRSATLRLGESSGFVGWAETHDGALAGVPAGAMLVRLYEYILTAVLPKFEPFLSPTTERVTE